MYYIGNKDLFYIDSFGIVGSRKITEYGINACKYFTKEFIYRKIPVVSGLAIGTDSVAHKTVVEYLGKTIAVLGHGLDYVYPQENEGLVEKIVANRGLVLTEYMNHVEPDKRNFPKRNRLISALSEGILVIEAAYRSGTSITVNYAKEQGKRVFALPGRLDNYLGIGVNKFIKEGAIFTTEIEDILKYYPQFINKKRIIYKPPKMYNKKTKKDVTEGKKKNEIGQIKEEYRDMYFLLKEEKNMQEIIEYTRNNITTILETLTNMEMEGLIKRKSNGNYIIERLLNE